MRKARGWRRLWQLLRQGYGFVEAVMHRLRGGHLYLLAAGIAFNVVLCFIPVGLLALWVFAGVVSTQVVEEALERVLILPLLPSEQLRRVVTAVMEQVELTVQRRSAIGVIGVVSLLWAASALLRSVRTGLHAAFQLPQPATGGLLLWGRLRDMLLTVVLVGLTLPLSLMLIGWGVLTAWGAALLPLAWRGVVQHIAGTVASVALEVALFGFLFRFVPLVWIPWSMVGRAVGIAVLLTEVLRGGFVWYLEHLAPWGWLYGGYAAVVSLVVWAYGVAFVLLLSGVIASIVRQPCGSVSEGSGVGG